MKPQRNCPWILAAVALIIEALSPARGLYAHEKEVEPKQVKAAIKKALPPLQKGAAGHVAQRTCFSCHHQALPVLALKLAQERGFAIDEDGLRKQLAFTHKALAQ